jgi:hypothetical protein
MSTRDSRNLSLWIARHTFFVWLGILLNMFFVVPLLLDPLWTLGLLDIPPVNAIWPRIGATLLLIISIFYIPPTIDLERYRVMAWLAIFPSRSFGATFFFFAVFVFGQPLGYISILLLDAFIGLATLICLIRVTALERARGPAGAWIGDAS